MTENKQQTYEIYPQTYFNLFETIRKYAQTGNKLPSEEALAVELGVSRSKIRDAMASLETQGYVSRKRGVGTLINERLLSETARLDIDYTFEELLTNSGFTSRIAMQKIIHLPTCPSHIAKHLNLTEEEGIYLVHKVVYANEVPTIDIYDYIPEKYFNVQEIDLNLLTKCVFYCVQSLCDELLESLIVHVEACEAGENVAKNLNLSPTSPVLKLETVCYSQSFSPIMYYENYFNTKSIPFSFQKRMVPSRYKI